MSTQDVATVKLVTLKRPKSRLPGKTDFLWKVSWTMTDSSTSQGRIYYILFIVASPSDFLTFYLTYFFMTDMVPISPLRTRVSIIALLSSPQSSPPQPSVCNKSFLRVSVFMLTTAGTFSTRHSGVTLVVTQSSRTSRSFCSLRTSTRLHQ